MKKIILNELLTNKRYLLISILISILTIIPNIILAPTLNVVIIMLISIFILVFISKFSKVIFSFFVLYINISNILIGHIALHWGYESADISARLYTMVISPTYEKIEYLKNYIDYRDVLLVLYILIVLYLIFKYIRACQHTFKMVRRISLGVTIGLVALLSFIPNNIKDIFYDVPYRFNKEPFNIPLKCVNLLNEPIIEFVTKRKEYMNQQTYKIDKNPTTFYDKVVIVIGESANKHHMGLYGYNKQTTPFLSSMNNNNKIFTFNAIAPSNQTRFSVPILLTNANVSDFKNQYIHSDSLIKKFHMKGYKTNWISTQAHEGKYDGSISLIGDESDSKVFFNHEKSQEAKNDSTILTYLDSKIQNKKKELTVIHLMGSHSVYTKRYSKEHSLYRNPKNIVEEYDNSIFFTDYILKNLYKYFSINKKLLFIYISDHSEVIKKGFNGHGFNPPYKDEYDIPFVVYSSVENPRLNTLYAENKKHYFNMENLNYMIEYISGFRDDANVSLSSKVFVLEPKNIVNYEDLKYRQ